VSRKRGVLKLSPLLRKKKRGKVKRSKCNLLTQHKRKGERMSPEILVVNAIKEGLLRSAGKRGFLDSKGHVTLRGENQQGKSSEEKSTDEIL